MACNSSEGARRTAERLALNNAGVIAFSMTSDPETGDYDGDPQATGRAAIYLQHKLRHEYSLLTA